MRDLFNLRCKNRELQKELDKARAERDEYWNKLEMANDYKTQYSNLKLAVEKMPGFKGWVNFCGIDNKYFMPEFGQGSGCVFDGYYTDSKCEQIQEMNKAINKFDVGYTEKRELAEKLEKENKLLKRSNKGYWELWNEQKDKIENLKEENKELRKFLPKFQLESEGTCPDGSGGVWSVPGHIFYKNVPNFKPVSVDCSGFKRTSYARLEVINPCIEPELMSNIWKKEVTEINLDYTNNVLELVFKESSKISETEHEALKYRFDQQLIKINDLENQNKDLKEKLNTMGNINRDMSYRIGKWEEIYDQAKWRNKEIIKSARKKKEEIKELKQKLNIIEKLGINANDEYWTFDLNKLNKVIKDSKPLGMSISSHTVSVPNSKVKYCECNCKWEQFKKDMEYYKNSSLSPVDRQVYINLLNKMKELERGRV